MKKDKPILLGRLFLNIFPILVLVLSSGDRLVTAGAPCLDTYCLFLPYVSSPAPVRFLELGHGCGGKYYDQVGARGNVVTTTSDPVYDVNIELRAFDQDDELITTTLGTPVFTATLPGQRNPFDVFFLNLTQVATLS